LKICSICSDQWPAL